MGEEDAGFSFVELLVVMVVIGLLAAIAIPMYRGQEDNARRTEAVHDMRATASAIEAWRSGAPTGRSYADLDGLDQDGLATEGVELNVGQWTQLQLNVEGQGYCLDGTHGLVPGRRLLYRNANGVVEVRSADAACA
jgi:type IV pilus assembly protein PilA